MSGLSPLARLADLLKIAAGILRTLSNTNLAKGIISRETRIAVRLEGISSEVAALEQRPH